MTKIINDAGYIFQLPNFHWSLERYHAAIAAGVLTEYDKVELLFGKLVPMSPVGIAHGKTVKKLNRLFNNRFDEASFTVGVQDPITLADNSEPEPDLFIAKGPLEDYDHHPYPEDILLVVEVSDTTLNRDRTAKKLAYALAGIPEYWVINVFERQLERFTSPDQEEGDYTVQETFKAGDSFVSEKLGDFSIDALLIAK